MISKSFTDMLEKIINTAALRNNWQAIRQRAHARNIFAVLKSDAYGHGLAACAETLADCADGIAVSAVEDALTLRDGGYSRPLLLLEGMFTAADGKAVAQANLWPVVHTAWQLTALENMPAGARLTVFLKINSGMNRLGWDADKAPAVWEFLRGLPAVREVVLMTHFANADVGKSGIAEPLSCMANLRGGLALSLGNSAATLFGGDIGDDWARVGISLYGSSPAPQLADRNALGLSPVMTLRTRLIALRHLQRGAPVGYGSEYTADGNFTAGIAAAGYSGGYPRRGTMQAMIDGVLVPVIGRVSMEMLILDLRAAPFAAVGDEITLWGDNPSVDDTAQACGDISYQLLTATGNVPKKII